MKSKWHVIWIVGLGVIGSVFLAGPYSPDVLSRWPPREQRMLAVITARLPGLKEALLKYRRLHGKYPDNNEGLGALDTFDARFEFGNEGSGDRECRVPANDLELGWPHIMLVRWREDHSGRPPTNAHEISSALGDRYNTETIVCEIRGTNVFAELAIDCFNNVYLVGSAGVLTPWRDPYMYENRIGMNPDVYRGSPANTDRKRQYSIRVDDGVYVYSVDAWKAYDCYREHWWARYTSVFIGVSVLVLDAFLVLVLCPRRSIALILSCIVGLMAGCVAHMFIPRTTCYVMSSPFEHRDQKAIAKQIELIEQYHTNGVINDVTYQRLMDATLAEKSKNIKGLR